MKLPNSLYTLDSYENQILKCILKMVLVISVPPPAHTKVYPGMHSNFCITLVQNIFYITNIT